MRVVAHGRRDGKAEIADFHRAIGVDKTVGWFDVAVQDAHRRGRFQAVDDL